MSRAANQIDAKWILDQMPGGIWLEDISGVTEYLNDNNLMDEEAFRSYFHQHPDRIWDISNRVVFEYINKTGLVISGYKSVQDLNEMHKNPESWPGSSESWTDYYCRELYRAWETDKPVWYRFIGENRTEELSIRCARICVRAPVDMVWNGRTSEHRIIKLCRDPHKTIDIEKYVDEVRLLKLLGDFQKSVIKPLKEVLE